MHAPAPDDQSFQVLFAANPLPMWLYDAESLQFLEINDAAVSHYGYTRDEFLQKRITDLRSPEDAERLVRDLRQAAPGLRRRANVRHRTREGRLLDVEIAAHTLEFRGRAAVLVVVHDVSERKHAEAGRKESEDALRRLNLELEQRVTQRTAELQAAVDELEAFSYSVSHDLRAPLRSIDGFSQAVVEDAGPMLTAETRQHLDRIRAATQRMGHLIDDLLQLSKVSRGDMSRETVDLSELAARIANDLNRRSSGQSPTLTVAPGLVALGDSRLLRILLENLLDNAWKFTSRQPDARVEIGGAAGPDGSAIFFVRDNGVGFDPAYAAKLFTPFQRLHALSDFPGTGIGLATVRRIVHRHGGRVWADGSPGRGACVSFTLEPPPMMPEETSR